jgi:hypothetical protein
MKTSFNKFFRLFASAIAKNVCQIQTRFVVDAIKLPPPKTTTAPAGAV